MKKLLILPNLYTPDDNSIWKAGLTAGWHMERCDRRKISVDDLGSYDAVRYYGNYLHQACLADQFPQKFHPLPHAPLEAAQQWTKRRIRLTSFCNLAQPLTEDAFIKPARDKYFEARVYRAGERIHGSPMADDAIYIQEPVEFMSEVRCFVYKGVILAHGHYQVDGVAYGALPEEEVLKRDSNLFHDHPQPLWMASEIADRFPELPPGVVMDFGQMKNGDWALIEFNEAWCSGLYYSDPARALSVIVASQENCACTAANNR